MAEELDGWHFRAAMDISPDGRSIVGFAAGPNSEFDAWLIKLDQPFNVPPLLTGDYNGDGTVEQGDLDLVLLQWGADAGSVSDTWTNDLPTGNVDQGELDKVLLGWGNTAAPIGAASVPEPTSALLVLFAIAAVLVYRVGHHGSLLRGAMFTNQTE